MAVRAGRSLRTQWHFEDWAMLLLVVAGTLLALSDFNHYGASWDELMDSSYARVALSAYRGVAPEWVRLGEGDYVELHGPAYLMASELAATGLARLRPAWSPLDARHFNNHLIFLVGLISLYLLTRQLAGRRAAFFASVLMASQPMLFGHSFINQKDIPFMAMFLASVAAGMTLAAKVTAGSAPTFASSPPSTSYWREAWRAAEGDWRRAGRGKRLLLAATVLLTAAVVLDVLILNSLLLPTLQAIVLRAHEGTSLTLINQLFSQVAPNAGQIPAAFYVDKITRSYLRLRPLIALLALAPAWIVGRVVFTSTRPPADLRHWLLGSGKPSAASVGRLLLAGVLLGLTISIRSLGVFAGVLVTLAMLLRKRPPMAGVLAYWAVAALASYATWPYLWADPVGGFLESLRTMAAFPWQGDILYAGRLWDAGATPWHFLPFLILVQVTLPAVALAILGLGIGVRRMIRRAMDRLGLALLVLWIGVPFAAAVIVRSIVYDNTRQFLFALPPLFILGGIGLDGLWSKVRSRVVGLAGVMLLLAPGVYGILTLHPYEYAYFNSLVGGIRGAYRSFETDYWCTSYREAMEQIGAIAPPGAVIAVSGPYHAAEEVARADLVIKWINDGSDPQADQVTFGLACTRTNSDLKFYPAYPVTGEVKADGATLAVVKDFRLKAPVP